MRRFHPLGFTAVAIAAALMLWPLHSRGLDIALGVGLAVLMARTAYASGSVPNPKGNNRSYSLTLLVRPGLIGAGLFAGAIIWLVGSIRIASVMALRNSWPLDVATILPAIVLSTLCAQYLWKVLDLLTRGGAK